MRGRTWKALHVALVAHDLALSLTLAVQRPMLQPQAHVSSLPVVNVPQWPSHRSHALCPRCAAVPHVSSSWGAQCSSSSTAHGVAVSLHRTSAPHAGTALASPATCICILAPATAHSTGLLSAQPYALHPLLHLHAWQSQPAETWPHQQSSAQAPRLWTCVASL